MPRKSPVFGSDRIISTVCGIRSASATRRALPLPSTSASSSWSMCPYGSIISADRRWSFQDTPLVRAAPGLSFPAIGRPRSSATSCTTSGRQPAGSTCHDARRICNVYPARIAARRGSRLIFAKAIELIRPG
jgi:hypothetical protein